MTDNRNQVFLRWLFYVTLIILGYFTFTVIPRGDESLFYKETFDQSYSVWPQLDLSPGWTLSSFYLWFLSGFYFIISFIPNVDLILAGRLISLICWVVLFRLYVKKGEIVSWKAAVILFNPYFLIYATRAHPLLPALVLSYFFWETFKIKKWLWTIFLLLGVNFQVFIGGISAMLLPRKLKEIDLKSLKFPALAGFFALLGVFLTWLTWGGVYPEAFVESNFFKEYYAGATISWGYFPLTLMLTGSFLWLTGEKTMSLKSFSSKKSFWVISSLIFGSAILILGKETVGILETIFIKIDLQGSGKWISIFFYFFLGLGWMKVHRDSFLLLMGVLASAILLSVLPFLYQRLAFFAIFMPCLIWIDLGRGIDQKNNSGLSLIVCMVFVIIAIYYELYGAL